MASLVCQDEAGNAATPGIPDELVQKWYSEDVFKKFHDSLTEVYGAYDPAATPTRRTLPNQEDTPEEPSRKRGRVVGPEPICKPEALKGQEISKARAGEGLHFYGLSFWNHFVQWFQWRSLDPHILINWSIKSFPE